MNIMEYLSAREETLAKQVTKYKKDGDLAYALKWDCAKDEVHKMILFLKEDTEKKGKTAATKQKALP